MQIDKYSQTQSFRGRNVEALDEMISEWCSRNNIIINTLSYCVEESNKMSAIISYNVKENIKEDKTVDLRREIRKDLVYEDKKIKP